MASFFKDNASLVAAVVLPILFASFFFVSKTIVSETGPKPQHDLIVATNTNNSNFDLDVINDAVLLRFTYPVADNNGRINNNISRQKPEIYYIHADTLVAEPIGYLLPDDAGRPAEDKQGTATTVMIDKLTGIKVNAASIAPDGYEFSISNSRRDGNIMTELYSSGSRSRNQWVLSKDGATHFVQGLDNRYRYHTEFIGWVVE